MKKTLWLWMMTAALSANGQGLGNLFSQKEADIKYKLAQIAKLQTYIAYLEKGYHIAQKGLTLIGDLKKGELDLHQGFFNSLQTVNPAIAGYARLTEMVSAQQNMISSFRKILQLKNIRPAEWNYLQAVYNHMADVSVESLSQLVDVLTDGVYEMTDNERLQRIDKLYTDMKTKNAFMQSFAAAVKMLSFQRQKDLNEKNFLQKLY